MSPSCLVLCTITIPKFYAFVVSRAAVTAVKIEQLRVCLVQPWILKNLILTVSCKKADRCGKTKSYFFETAVKCGFCKKINFNYVNIRNLK
jgi:hypothetical protein